MDNFTNQDNNMQNPAGNTYSYDYNNANNMNMNTNTNVNNTYSQSAATPNYSQPGTYTGATAQWQAQRQAQQQMNNAYTQNYQNAYNAAPADPYGYGATAKPKKPLIGLAIASMVLGILSIVCCCFLGYWTFILSITSIVLGIIALVKDYAGKGMAVAGVICSGISIVLLVILLILSMTGSALLEDLVNDIYRELGYDIRYYN